MGLKSDGYRSLAEGEQVEYDTEFDSAKGKSKAINVTGPGGGNVQGAPRQGGGGGGYYRAVRVLVCCVTICQDTELPTEAQHRLISREENVAVKRDCKSLCIYFCITLYLLNGSLFIY